MCIQDKLKIVRLMNNIDILVYGWNSTPDEAIIPISPASQPTNQKKKLPQFNFNSISTTSEAELALISISPASQPLT